MAGAGRAPRGGSTLPSGRMGGGGADGGQNGPCTTQRPGRGHCAGVAAAVLGRQRCSATCPLPGLTLTRLRSYTKRAGRLAASACSARRARAAPRPSAARHRRYAAAERGAPRADGTRLCEIAMRGSLCLGACIFAGGPRRVKNVARGLGSDIERGGAAWVAWPPRATGLAPRGRRPPSRATPGAHWQPRAGLGPWRPGPGQRAGGAGLIGVVRSVAAGWGVGARIGDGGKSTGEKGQQGPRRVGCTPPNQPGLRRAMQAQRAKTGAPPHKRAGSERARAVLWHAAALAGAPSVGASASPWRASWCSPPGAERLLMPFAPP
jgi:hypothetical protein